MDVPTANMLQILVRKEGRSLLQYVSESFPWTTAKNQPVLAAIVQMAKEEEQATAALVGFLIKNRVRPPAFGAYPMSFTNINYMSWEFLLPYLVDFESRHIAELEQFLTQVNPQEDAYAVLRSHLEMKKRHLAILTSLAEPQKPAA